MSNDLDFDELHKEVSKLMDRTSKPKAKKAAPKPADKPQESAKDTPKEAAVTPKEEPKPAETITVRRSAAQVVPRRPGVAMDIVQPSKTSVEPPSVRASRTALTIQPTGPIEPEPPHPREAAIAPTSPPAKEDVSDETLASLNLQKDSKPAAGASEDHDATSTFPDPLDVHGFTDGEEKASGEASVFSPPTMEHATPTLTPSAEKPADEPATDTGGTPFVNAKVEKRPLGAFAETAPGGQSTVEPEEPGDTIKDTSSKEEKPETAAINVPAPPKELNPELVAVESAEPEFTPGSPEAKKTSVNDLRQMSIPQQYKAADAEPSREDRPVFDTKTYHPPLQPVTKVHKTGSSRAGMLLTIILIILLIAAGVVAYFVATGAIDVNSLLKSL
jgi:hypothetical protein